MPCGFTEKPRGSELRLSAKHASEASVRSLYGRIYASLLAVSVNAGAAGAPESQTPLPAALSVRARRRALATQVRYSRNASAVARMIYPPINFIVASCEIDVFDRGLLAQAFTLRGGVPGYPDSYYRGEWHACDRYFEADDCPHCDGPPYDESKLRAIKPQGLAWKLIDAARRGAAQDAASRGPSRRPSLDTFVVDEGGRAVWGTDARSACGDVGDVDMAASSRYSSRTSSGRSSL